MSPSGGGPLAVRTDIGHVRERNEDAYAVSADAWVVCDGLGGHPAGDVAARLAASTVLARLVAPDNAHREPETRMRSAIYTAHQAILQAGNETAGLRDMGAAVVAGCRLETGEVAIAHVGDCRAYQVTERLLRLTEDHTVAERLVDLGHLSDAEARHHPTSNQLIQYVGLRADRGLFIPVTTVHARGRLLLCTDGLHGVLDDSELAGLLGTADPARAADLLIAAALHAGGPDNITVVLVDLPADG